MHTIDLLELKRIMVELADEVRGKISQHNEVSPFHTGALSVINSVLLWVTKSIQEGAIDMEKMKTDIQVKIVSLEDIPRRQREHPVEDQITAYATQLEEAIKAAEKLKRPKPALEIEGGIKYQYFAAKLSRMRKQGKLDPAFRVLLSGEKFYLTKQ